MPCSWSVRNPIEPQNLEVNPDPRKPAADYTDFTDGARRLSYLGWRPARSGINLSLAPRHAGAVVCPLPFLCRGADEGQELLRALIQLRLGFGFQVQPNQRLGVGTADVKPPVGKFHAESVEFELFAVAVLVL